MTYPTITPLPAAPNRTQAQSTFSNNTNAFLAALPAMVTQTNTAGDYIEQAVLDTDADRVAAAASAAEAAASAATVTSSANFAGAWSSLTGALNKPASVLHSSKYWQLLNNLADVTVSEPGVTGDWSVIVDTAAGNTVIPHTGGGTLTALRINELRDADAYFFPLANSVSANQIITINLPQRYPTGATVTRSGSDTIEGLTSDTSITFNVPASITLTSNGVDEWSL